MCDEVIYEGKYADMIRKLGEQEDAEDHPSYALTAGDSKAYIRDLLSNTVSVFMPDRVEKAVNFVKTANEVAEENMIDITFSVNDTYVTAAYSLECDTDFHCLKPAISQADEIIFKNNGDKIVLSLSYYIHATYLSGKKISTLDE